MLIRYAIHIGQTGNHGFRREAAMAIRIGINGFGRIGRTVFRTMKKKGQVNVFNPWTFLK